MYSCFEVQAEGPCRRAYLMVRVRVNRVRDSVRVRVRVMLKVRVRVRVRVRVSVRTTFERRSGVRVRVRVKVRVRGPCRQVFLTAMQGLWFEAGLVISWVILGVCSRPKLIVVQRMTSTSACVVVGRD